MTNEERLPPHSVEAEEATLGGILIDPDAIYDVAHLEPRHFSRIKNRDIFRAMRKLVAEEKPIDFIMVSELLNHEDDPYLVGLLNVVPTSVETRHYANIVFELAKRRELLSAASKIATLAYDEEQQIDAILGVAQNSVLDVASNMLADGPKSAADGFSELFDAVVARQASDGLERKISTGFSDIDYILSHLRGGALYVLAARPGMGKSMLESNG